MIEATPKRIKTKLLKLTRAIENVVLESDYFKALKVRIKPGSVTVDVHIDHALERPPLPELISRKEPKTNVNFYNIKSTRICGNITFEMSGRKNV